MASSSENPVFTPRLSDSNNMVIMPNCKMNKGSKILENADEKVMQYFSQEKLHQCQGFLHVGAIPERCDAVFDDSKFSGLCQTWNWKEYCCTISRVSDASLMDEKSQAYTV